MAMRAARSPSQGRGSKKPNMAREGMVWRMLAMPITGRAQRGERARRMPAGMAMAAAKNMAEAVSHRCSMVRVRIVEAFWERKLMGRPPEWEGRWRGRRGALGGRPGRRRGLRVGRSGGTPEA